MPLKESIDISFVTPRMKKGGGGKWEIILFFACLTGREGGIWEGIRGNGWFSGDGEIRYRWFYV